MTQKRCSTCAELLSDSAAYCLSCGADVTDEMVLVDPQSTSARDSAPIEASGLFLELSAHLAPRIQVIREIGRGGMGAVFLARDPVLRRSVAVKILSPEFSSDPTARTRFLREAEAAATVNHPNVVSIFEVGELPSGAPYFIMQFIEGQNLGELLESHGLFTDSRAKRIVGEVASALAAAHARGLVHRDMKPANVMVDAESDRAMVLDFGISAVLHRDTTAVSEKLTAVGSYIGTPRYTSPEQAAGDVLTGKSDVYSLGITAFELLTGKLPFPQQNPMALMAAHMKDPPPKLNTLRSDLDPAFAAIVDRCLEKDPERRPSAAELAAYLNPGARSLIEWPPPGLESLRGQGAHFLNALALMQTMLLLFVLLLGTQPTRGGAAWHSGEQSVLWSTMANALSGADPTNFQAEDASSAWIVLVILSLAASLLVACIVITRGMSVTAAVRMGTKNGYPVALLSGVALDGWPDTPQLLNGMGSFATIPLPTRERIAKARRARIVALPLALFGSVVLYALWVFGLLVSSGSTDAPVMTSSEAVLILLPTLLGSLLYGVLHAQEIRALGFQRMFGGRSGAQRLTPPELVRTWMLGAIEVLPKLSAPAPSRFLPLLAASLVLSISALAVSITFVSAHLVMLPGSADATREGSQILESLLPVSQCSGSDCSTVIYNRPRGPAHFDSVMQAAVRTVRTGSPGDSMAMRTIVAGLYAEQLRRNSTLDGFDHAPLDSGERADAQAVVRLVGDTPPWPGKRATSEVWKWNRMYPAEVVSIPLPEADVRLLAEDTVTPWLSVLRRVAHAPALTPPFGVPGPAMLANSARFDRSPTWYRATELLVRQSSATYLALSAGRMNEAEMRARETLSVGYQFVRSPLWEEERFGSQWIRRGASDLMLIARTTSNAQLLQEAAGIQKVLAELLGEHGNAYAQAGLWALMSDARDASPPGFVVLRDTRLIPEMRFRAASAVVDGFCLSQREVIFGVSPRRMQMLDSADRMLSDIPRAHEWIAAHRAHLEQLISDPVKSVQQDRVAGRIPADVPSLLRWIGFRAIHARLSYCAEIPGY